MKKRIILILVLLVIVAIIIGVCIVHNRKNKNDSNFYAEKYSKCNHFDDEISDIMNSKEYKAMDDDEKVKTMDQFLKLCESSGVIKDLFYDADVKMYSFVYASGDLEGTLGGVSLKEFDSMFN